MRYISLFTHEAHGKPPSEEEITAMGKLIDEGLKSGWLIVTEGVAWGSKGTRVKAAAGGDVSVTDGPFAEAKEVVGGYAILRARSKEEVVKLCENFLRVAGGGTCEFHELYETPASDRP